MEDLQKILNNLFLQKALAEFLQEYEIENLVEAMQIYAQMHQTYICRTKTSVTKINIKDIYYLKIYGHNISIHTDQAVFSKYGSLAKELPRLSCCGFMKCSQNCVVSLYKINSIRGNDILLKNNEIIHMSKKYASKVIAAFTLK